MREGYVARKRYIDNSGQLSPEMVGLELGNVIVLGDIRKKPAGKPGSYCYIEVLVRCRHCDIEYWVALYNLIRRLKGDRCPGCNPTTKTSCERKVFRFRAFRRKHPSIQYSDSTLVVLMFMKNLSDKEIIDRFMSKKNGRHGKRRDDAKITMEGPFYFEDGKWKQRRHYDYAIKERDKEPEYNPKEKLYARN